MKKTILTLITILVSIFQSYSQSPTYEQTVEYLNKNVKGRMMYKGPLDSYARATGYKLTNIKIEKNGRIEFRTNQKNGINDFSIVFNLFDLSSSIDYPDGVRAHKFLVHFKGLNVTEGYGITFATENDAKKVARALRHLKTLCSQEGDLFSAPTEKERKATLTIDETMKYIAKIVNNQKDLISNSTHRSVKTITDQEISKTGYIFYEIYYANMDDEHQYVKSKTEFSFNFTEESCSYVEIGTNMDGNYPVYLNFRHPKYIESTYKSKGSRKYSDSKSEAYSVMNNDYWSKTYTDRNSSITFYVKTLNEAKRLKKAFEHLNALINETKIKQVSDDPFGE